MHRFVFFWRDRGDCIEGEGGIFVFTVILDLL